MEGKRFRQLLLNRVSLSLLALVLLANILLLILAALDYYPKIVNVDGLYSAQVARNLLEGKGYTTSEMTLYEVTLYFEKGWLQLGPPWVNSGRFPLPVLIRAGLFLFTGDNYLVATYLYSMSFQLISVITVFIVSLYLFRERMTAFFGSLFFAASPVLIFSGINGKETTSDFALFMIVLGLVASWRGQTRPRLSRIFILGLTVGIAYLNRYNLGGVLLLALVPLVVKDVLSKSVPLSRLFKMIISFAAGFALMIAPLAIYNAYTFGDATFSSNALLQFTAFTRPVKYMNPWWKLSYPFDTANPLSALNMFSGDIISRTLSNMAGSLVDFLAMGIAGSGYTWFWWIPVAVSAIAGLWPRLSKGIGFPNTASENLRAGGLVWYFLLFNLLLDLPILGLFTAGVEYVWYLYSALALLAGFGLTRIVRLIQAQTPSIMEGLKMGGRSKTLAERITNRRIGLVAFGGLLLGAVLSLGQLPFAQGIDAGELQIIVFLVAASSAVALFKYRRPALPLALVFLVLLIPTVRYGVLGSNAAPSIVPNWITDENQGMLQYITTITRPNGIVLSAEPWNVAWWSDRPSLPFSEFPDEIFLMMAEYHLNIQAIYIANLNSVFYRDINAPYTYEAYRRIAAYDYTMKGFTPVARGFSDGQPSILLLRDGSVDLNSLLQTTRIDFGAANDSSHLVWGWSEKGLSYGVNSAWAQRPGGLPLGQDQKSGLSSCPAGLVLSGGQCLPYVTYNQGLQPVLAGIPDAEFTFLSTTSASRNIVLRVLSPVVNQSMMVVLNSNLLYFGQAGTLLTECNCTIRNSNTWVNVSISIPAGIIRDGVNMVSFIFPGTSNLMSYRSQTEQLLLFDSMILQP